MSSILHFPASSIISEKDGECYFAPNIVRVSSTVFWNEEMKGYYISTTHQLRVEDVTSEYWLDIYPLTDEQGIVTRFAYTGFHSTCKKIVNYLGLKEGMYDIY